MTRSWIGLAFAFACTACGGGATKPTPVAEFNAQDSDVADFPNWYSQPFVADALADIVYPPGSRFGFINHPAPPGVTSYPVGTIIIKAIENDKDPTHWELFGISKRGGDYNAAGAIGWDFLLIRYENGAPHIYSRGLTPTVDGNPDMMAAVNEGSYFAGGQIACDVCHGLKKYAPYDYIIDQPFELNRDAGPPDLAVSVPTDAGAVDGGTTM